MILACKTWSVVAVLVCGFSLNAASITYIGMGTVAGSGTDFSGLTESISGGAGTIAHNTLGAFGSAIAFTGSKNLYVMVNDRGYSDGITTPSYIAILWTTNFGQFLLAAAGMWMSCGILVMRKMINFKY